MDLDRIDFGNEKGYSFLLKTRSLCGYIERMIKPLKIHTEGFNRIVINGKKDPKEPYINSCRVLSVELSFDEARYLLLTGEEEIFEFLIQMLKEGITIGNQIAKLPVDAIHESIESFRNNEFKNEWKSKRRLNRSEKVYAQFDCHLSMDSFELFLVIEKQKKEIFRERILKTDPDPVAYYSLYKDIIFDGDKLIVTSRTSQPLFTMDLKDKIHNK